MRCDELVGESSGCIDSRSLVFDNHVLWCAEFPRYERAFDFALRDLVFIERTNWCTNDASPSRVPTVANEIIVNASNPLK